MLMTTKQTEDLAELFNIAAGRAMSSLADLSEERVLIGVPQVQILATSELPQTMGTFIHGDVAAVYQIFGGAVDGTALIVLDYPGAVTLVNLIAGNDSDRQQMDESAAEVFTEVGNILLNATMSTFGDILEKRITFSVPHIRLDALDGLIHSMTIGNRGLKDAMLAYTTFRIETSDFSGYLVVLMSVTSLVELLQALESAS